MDKSQIWAVRSGSGGPDLSTGSILKFLIYTARLGSDGSPCSTSWWRRKFAGGRGGGGGALGRGRSGRFRASPDARRPAPDAAQHGEWNGGDGWWRGAPVLDLLLAGVAGGGGQLLSMTGTVFWRAKETRPS